MKLLFGKRMVVITFTAEPWNNATPIYVISKVNKMMMSKTFQERLFARNYFTIRINILKY